VSAPRGGATGRDGFEPMSQRLGCYGKPNPKRSVASAAYSSGKDAAFNRRLYCASESPASVRSVRAISRHRSFSLFNSRAVARTVLISFFKPTKAAVSLSPISTYDRKKFAARPWSSVFLMCSQHWS